MFIYYSYYFHYLPLNFLLFFLISLLFRYVDGQDVQYWKRLDSSQLFNNSNKIESMFHGFKKDTNDLRSFVFASPISTSNSSDLKNINQHQTQPLGSIKVVIFEAIQVEGIIQNSGGKYEVPGQTKVSIDGKFLQQPSITTVGGRNITEVEKFVPLLRWKNKTDIPMITLNLYYHSPEMIRFLTLYHNTPTTNLSNNNNINNNNNNRSEKRKFDEIIDLTEEEATINTSNDQSFERVNSTTSFPHSNYSIHSVEIANDDIEILTVVKEIPVVDITTEDD